MDDDVRRLADDVAEAVSGPPFTSLMRLAEARRRRRRARGLVLGLGAAVAAVALVLVVIPQWSDHRKSVVTDPSTLLTSRPARPTASSTPDAAPPEPTSPPAFVTPPGLVLGPGGVGRLRLGMTSDEVDASGEARTYHGSAHDGWPPGCRPILWRGANATAGDDTGGVVGQVSPRQGLEVLVATPQMRTPEGIGLGSTLDEVEAVVPGPPLGPFDYRRVPASATTVYYLGMGKTDLEYLALELEDTDCGR